MIVLSSNKTSFILFGRFLLVESAKGELPLVLHAGYRSILVLASLANTRAGQSERRSPPAPIRTPERPKANSIHTAVRHA